MDRIMFSSDYPHWDFDDPFVSLPPSLTDAQRRMIYAGNARGALPALMAKKHVVAAVSEIPPGGRKLVTADGRAIVVFNLGGEFFALCEPLPASRRQPVPRQPDRAGAVRRARRVPTTSAAARSSAVPGTPGSSTSAPASPGAIPRR